MKVQTQPESIVDLVRHIIELQQGKVFEFDFPSPEELREIMKVQEVRDAITMANSGQEQEATALLSKFKQKLEKKVAESSKFLSDDGGMEEDAAYEKASGTPGTPHSSWVPMTPGTPHDALVLGADDTASLQCREHADDASACS